MAAPSNQQRITSLKNEVDGMKDQLSQALNMLTQLTNGQATQSTPQAVATATVEEWQPSEKQVTAHWQQNGHMTRNEIIADLQAIYADDMADEADDEATELEAKPATTNRQRRQSRKLSRTKKGLPKPQTRRERQFGLSLKDHPEAMRHVVEKLSDRVISIPMVDENLGNIGHIKLAYTESASGTPLFRMIESSVGIDLGDGTAVTGRIGYAKGQPVDIPLYNLVQPPK